MRVVVRAQHIRGVDVGYGEDYHRGLHLLVAVAHNVPQGQEPARGKGRVSKAGKLQNIGLLVGLDGAVVVGPDGLLKLNACLLYTSPSPRDA